MIKNASNILVVEDFPPEIAERRRLLYPIVEAAYKYKDPNNPSLRYNARIIVDRLIINDTSYTVDTLDQLPPALRPELISTPTNEDTVVFFTKASPLSNHYPCNFVVNQKTYTSMEQYLMEQKSLHFNDTNTAREIMKSNDPVSQKRMGKQVQGFDRVKWENQVPEVLLRGLKAKFLQDKYCGEFLKKTGDKVIGEANPNDSFYGIGIGLRSMNVWNKSAWGHNLLGASLMEVRSELE